MSTMEEELLEVAQGFKKKKEEETEIIEEKQEEETQIKIPIVEQILDIVNKLDEIDKYFNDLPNLQSQIDEEISDLLHYIENNEITSRQASKMIKILQEKRLVRRGLCNDYEIKRVYNGNRNKLVIDTQRTFFVNEIHKKAKELNSKYHNRRITDEEIKNLIK